MRAAPRRVLLVEDNQDQREVVTIFLQSHGHSVVSVADGAAAVAEARNGAFDVAFIDIGLPDMDGFAVAERLRSELGDAIRLFALTGYGFSEDRARSRAAGFDGHLVKPVDPDTLATILSARAFEGPADDQT